MLTPLEPLADHLQALSLCCRPCGDPRCLLSCGVTPLWLMPSCRAPQGCLLGGRSPSGLGRAPSPDGTHPARSGELRRWGQGTCCAQGGSWPRGWPRAGVDSGQCSPGCRPRGPSPPSPPIPRRRSGVRWGAARPGGAEESLRHHGDGRTAPGRAQGQVTNVLASTRVLHPVPSASPAPRPAGPQGDGTKMFMAEE